MHTLLVYLAAVSIIMIVIAVFVTASRPFRKKSKGRFGPGVAIFVYAAALIQIGLSLLCGWIFYSVPSDSVPAGPGILQNPFFPKETTLPTEDASANTTGTAAVPTETEDPRLSFQPAKNDNSDPENFGIVWDIINGEEIVESYSRSEPISFELDTEYFVLPGVATFRGNNYRNNPAYGTAEVSKGIISVMWKHSIGRYNNWGGCAWTGQPLVVQWDEETKAIMNMYNSKKQKDGLVEVIYATLDGNIHFYDMEDGTQTRDKLFIGMNFKGAGALDPRGYPLLYVGSGIDNGGRKARMFIISLIDGSILYENGFDDSFAERKWTAFDSSPLVDAETDTLIWPGENGLLYTIKLNTNYDKAAGTITIDPDEPVRTRYASTYSEEEDRYLGYEASAVVVDNYLFTSENGGLFHCVDLNTMELLWAQDTKDDSNSSPLFEWDENGNGYIYTAPSLHWTAEGHDGTVSIYKLDASNGNIVWEYPFPCVRYDDIAGGVQCSPLIGKEGTELEGMILYSLARTPTAYKGNLIALNKETGEPIWEVPIGNYAWSSPAAFYTDEGEAYIFIANASGVARILDGSTGETLSTINFKQTVEASPVIFNNMLVIGSREAIYGIKIS